MENLTYQYRIYPNKTQEQAIEFCFSMGWRVWNDALHMRKVAWETERKFISWQTLDKAWGQFRRDNEELQALPYDTITQVIKRLEKAYSAFFRRLSNNDPNAGFPREKKRHEFTSLEFRYGKGAKLTPQQFGVAHLRLYGMGDIRVHYHRPLPCGATPKMIVILKERDEWYVNVLLEFDEPDEPIHYGAAVGIDLGMVYLLALSDENVMENPRWYREGQSERRVLARRADRRMRKDKNGRLWGEQSKGYKEVRKVIADHEAAIARQREYFWHTVTDYLTKTYSLIALEDLTLEFMQQNKRLAMSVYDASFGIFWQMLEYKAKRTGCKIIYVPAEYTSQTCHKCGCIDRENRKTQATFKCVHCGHEANADINAAKNILKRALNTLVQRVDGETQANGSNVP